MSSKKRVANMARRVLASTSPGIPQEAAIVQPRGRETNEEARARHLEEYPEQDGAPTIFLRLSREAPGEH